MNQAADSTLFVVDDDRLFRDELEHLLTSEGYSVSGFGNIADCRVALEESSPRVILLDIQLPDGNGVDFLKELISQGNHPEVIMISGAASLQDAADSVKLGASDFLEKPFEPQRLVSIVRSCFRIANLKAANRNLLESKLAGYKLIGNSAIMQSIRSEVKQIAATDSRVLISGESGTGKEIVAGQIHYLSSRADRPFIKLNCSAIPSELVESELFGHVRGAFTGAYQSCDGKFSAADGGSLLLDEIGDMPLDVQPKLLRVIETGEVERLGSSKTQKTNVRLISSTNRDLQGMASKGEFRQDLLYRINIVLLTIPSLRNHREDIPDLVRHFVEELSVDQHSHRVEFAEEAIGALMDYSWPGNVRQLRNIIERLLFTGRDERITATEVRACIGGQSKFGDRGEVQSDGNRLSEAVTNFERQFLSTELRNANDNVSLLARRLGMDRGNLYRKLKKLGLLSN